MAIRSSSAIIIIFALFLTSCQAHKPKSIACIDIPGQTELSLYEEVFSFSNYDSLSLYRYQFKKTPPNHDTWLAFLHKGELQKAAEILSQLIAHPPAEPIIYSASMDTPFLLLRLSGIFEKLKKTDSANKYLAIYRNYTPEPAPSRMPENPDEILYQRIKAQVLVETREPDSAISLLLRSNDNLYNMNQAISLIQSKNSREQIALEIENGLNRVTLAKNDYPECYGEADSVAFLKFFGRRILLEPPDSVQSGQTRRSAYIEHFRASNLYKLATCTEQ